MDGSIRSKGPYGRGRNRSSFLGPRTGRLVPEFSQKWKENNDGTNKWEYHEPYVCLGVIVFKQVLDSFITGIGDDSRRCLEQAVLINLSSSLEPLYLRGAKFKINASRD